MLADRRDRIRKQIRSQTLSRRFAMQRKALMKGVQSVFYELCAEMDELTESDIFEMNARLVACAEQYPQQENTYILIGNWLSRHPEMFDYFQLHLTDTYRLFDNYVWSLAHLENIYLQNYDRIADCQRRVRGIVVMVTEMAREIFARGCSLTKMAYLQDNYILILRRLIEKNLDLGEMVDAIHLALLFIENIAEITPTTEAIQKEFSNEQLDNYLDFFLSLKEVNEWQFLRNHGLEVRWSRAFAIIAVPILRNLPQSREDCLRVLGYLLSHEKDARMMDKTFFKELLNQLLFLMQEVPNLLPIILMQFKLMLDQCQILQLTQMLQMGVHIRLVRGIQLSMQRCDNLLLENCLAATFGLLTRLSFSEPKLMLRVKEDVEEVNFHHMIQGLIQNDQNQIVGNLVNNIVDDFYSEEVTESL